MAKRELSSTLRNLKFMNRAAQKDEKAKKEVEIKDDGNFASPSQTRKCMVIMEGNPPPGALKGRMSFQSFNPSIDKLNEEATSLHQPPVPATTPNRDSGSPQTSSEPIISRTNSDSDGDHKRKQPEDGDDHGKHLNKSSRNASDGSPNNGNGSHKKQQQQQQQQRDKLNWNLLRPPKPTHKRN